MSDHYDRYNGMEKLLSTNLAEVGTDGISRQQAIDAIKERYYKYGRFAKIEELVWSIEKLPPIQPEPLQPWEVLAAQAVLSQPAEPKRGRWIEDKGQQTLMQCFIAKGEVWRVCSECGAGHMIGHKYECDKAYHEVHHNFCPNCGADMRGEQDG